MGPEVPLLARRDADRQRPHLHPRSHLAGGELNTNLEETLKAGLYPFVIGDLIKLYLAGALLPLAWLGVKRVRGEE